jgi:hypothetical protein
MLKIKKGLANILENNNEPGEEAPQPQTQSVRTALKLNEQDAAPQLLRSVEHAVQPPQPRPRLGRWGVRWGGRSI